MTALIVIEMELIAPEISQLHYTIRGRKKEVVCNSLSTAHRIVQNTWPERAIFWGKIDHHEKGWRKANSLRGFSYYCTEGLSEGRAPFLAVETIDEITSIAVFTVLSTVVSRLHWTFKAEENGN